MIYRNIIFNKNDGKTGQGSGGSSNNSSGGSKPNASVSSFGTPRLVEKSAHPENTRKKGK